MAVTMNSSQKISPEMGQILSPSFSQKSLRDLESALENRAPLVLLSTREPQLQSSAIQLLQRLPEHLSNLAIGDEDLDSGLVLLRSSGSMSAPAWILNSQRRLRQAAVLAAQSLSFDHSCSWRLTVPLNHVSGLGVFLRCQETGGALLLPDDTQQETHLSLVPTQLFRLLENSKSDFSSITPNISGLRKLRCLLLGGAPLDTALRRRCVEEEICGVMSYGLSETGALIAHTGLGNDDEFTFPMNAGQLLGGWRYRLSDENEICLNGPNLALARISHDGATCQAFGEWFPTGDLGQTNQRGGLLVKGRKGNLIISGGENIQAEEIEEALRQLPIIDDAIVLPMDDPEYGQRPAAFVQWRQGGSPLTLEVLRNMLEPYLPRFKHPHQLFEWPEGPKEFKPSRANLRALLTENDGVR
jgi:o-succinylbenzoate---CoA ligase